MTTTRTASQLGSANRRRGHQAERDLARWLRSHGWPHAERAVRTGYRAANRTSADPGDITGCPGLVISVKDCAVERIDTWMTEMDAMSASPRDLLLLVQRRRGHADPGRWWCWLRSRTLATILGAPSAGWSDSLRLGALRMELGHVVPLLHAAGYGDTP